MAVAKGRNMDRSQYYPKTLPSMYEASTLHQFDDLDPAEPHVTPPSLPPFLVCPLLFHFAIRDVKPDQCIHTDPFLCLQGRFEGCFLLGLRGNELYILKLNLLCINPNIALMANSTKEMFQHIACDGAVVSKGEFVGNDGEDG